MTGNEYQNAATKTAVYPDIGHNIIYPTLGLCGEAGEFADKVKKMIRDDGGKLTEERRNALALELGDLAWYLSQCARELGFSLEEVFQANIDKLASRAERNKLKGSGDNR